MRRASALAVGGVLFSFLFLGELREGRVFAYRDAVYYHLPVSRMVSAELRAGRFPFWNPGIACGTPLSANPNHYAFYPSRLLELVASPETALQVHFFAHWIAGGAAMAALAGALGAGAPAAAGAAALFLLCGPALSLLNFANLAPFLFWAPATMLALLRLVRGPSARRAAWLAVCLAIQTTFVEPVLLATEAMAALALLAGAGGVGQPRAVLGWGALSAGIALLLSAPMAVPLVGLVADSARAGDVRAALGSAVPGAGLLQIAVPQLTGDYHTLEKLRFWGEAFHEGKGPFFLSISFGAAALALAAGALAARPRAGGALLAAAAVGCLLAMGPHFPPLKTLTSAAGAGFLRWPVKFTFVAALVLPLLVAIALEALRGPRRKRTALVTACAAATLFCGALLAAGSVEGAARGEGWLGRLLAGFGGAKDEAGIAAEVHARFLRTAAFAGAATALGAASAFFGGRARLGAALAAGLALLPVLELAPPQRAVNRGTPLEVVSVDTPILARARAVAERGYRVHFPRHHWDVRLARREGMPDEWWPRVGLDREIGAFYHALGEGVPMVLASPDRLNGANAAARAVHHAGSDRLAQERMLRLLGVGATVRLGHEALQAGMRPLATSAGYPVLLEEDPGAQPIASWIATLPDLGDTRPWSLPFLDRATEHVHEYADPAAVRIQERTPGRWSLRSSAPREGWVTLTESRVRGWRARVDGEDARIEPYLHDFMAVRVPPGSHAVEWRYRPPGFSWLLAASVLGGIGAAWLAFGGRRSAPSRLT